MSLVELPNHLGICVMPFGEIPVEVGAGSSVVNAVGESMSCIGKINLSTGFGTSKVISSAGGKIWFNTGTVTWGTAGSTLRVGIQDVNTGTGIEDGTFDVYKDMVQGTDAVAANSTIQVTMASGTKTITHGDLIAIVLEMTVRNGTDSITLLGNTPGSAFPYCCTDTGAGSAKNNALAPIIIIAFDDGTIGYFEEFTIPKLITFATFSSISSPDEYAFIFQLPFKCTINALIAGVYEVDAGETGTISLVTDPLGSPSYTVNRIIDPSYEAGLTGIGSGIFGVYTIAETTLLANTVYAVAYRATSVGTRYLKVFTLADGNHRKAMMLGTNCFGGTRTDSTGVFTSSMTIFTQLGFRINKLDDGVSGGASSAAYIG